MKQPGSPLMGDKQFRKKLEQVLAVFAKVALGDFSGKLRMPEGEKDDQCSEIFEGINIMLDVMRSQYGELKGLNKDLEGRVAARTKELENELSERKKTERALRNSEAKWRSLLDNAADFIIAVDHKHRILSINRTTPGLSIHDVIGKSVYGFVQPEHRKTMRLAINRVFRTGKITNYEIVGHGGPGKMVWYATRVGPVREGKKIVAVTLISTDITRRKQMEDSLSKAEQRFRTLYESSRDAIMTLEPPRWAFTSGNAATINMFKVKDEAEFISKGPWALSPKFQPDGSLSSTKAKAMIMKAMRKGSNFFEWTHMKNNGETFPATVLLTKVKLEGKSFLQATVREISEQKRNEEKIIETNRFLDAVLENIPNMLFVKDAKDLRFVRFNRAGEELLGYPREALLGKSDYDFFPKKQADFFTAKDRAVLKGRRLLDIPEEPINTLKKGERWLHTKKIPLIDENNRPLYLLGISEDITERRALEKQLSDYNKKLEELVLKRTDELRKKLEQIKTDDAKDKAILESIGEGMIATDDTGKIIIMNHAAEVLLGWSAEKAIGTVVYDVFRLEDESGQRKPDDHHKFTFSILHGHAVASTPLETLFCLRQDGSKFPVSFTVAPIQYKKTIGGILVFHDISKEKEMDQAKSDLISMASHQLRTPLAITKWCSENLLKECGPTMEGEPKKWLQDVHNSNTRMVEMVDALLQVSRIALGTFRLEKGPVSVQEVTRQVIHELESAVEQKGLKLTIRFAPLAKVILTDPQLVQIIFQNLVSNAIKYTPAQGKITLIVRMKTPKTLLISVADTGIGIPAEDQDKIFGKLFRAQNARNKFPDGNGLGLYIVKSLVDQAGGSVTFTSKEKKGTTFTVVLPVGK